MKVIFCLLTVLSNFLFCGSFRGHIHRPSFVKLTNAFMFSGIVEELGSVESLKVEKNVKMWDGSVVEGYTLEINGNTTLEDAYIGCSISCNGVCLTVTSINHSRSSFTFGLAPETLRRSNLGKLRTGSKVNLERALLNSECFHLFLYIR